MIYDARCNIGIFSPLFNPFDYRPHKAYYAFKAFNELYTRKTEVKSSSSDPWRTWVVAARGEKDGAVVIAHPIYDWLNCMGSSAAALLELDDACSKGNAPCRTGDM